MPLKPQVLIEPFEQWALDFVGPINPPSNGKRYILVCTDYVTKWVEAKAVTKATENTVVTFLFEEIFVRYGVPRQIVTDQGAQFTSTLVRDLTEKYKIKHRKSTPYHPQANKQIHTYKLAAKLGLDLSEAQQQQIVELNQLDEHRQQGIEHTTLVQQQRMKWHDRFIKNKTFHKGDWALLFDSKFKDFKAKFTTHWLGPYEIEEIFDNGVVKIKTIDKESTSLLVNGHRLEVYNRPISKEAFMK
eukprot:PITA_12991